MPKHLGWHPSSTWAKSWQHATTWIHFLREYQLKGQPMVFLVFVLYVLSCDAKPTFPNLLVSSCIALDMDMDSNRCREFLLCSPDLSTRWFQDGAARPTAHAVHVSHSHFRPLIPSLPRGKLEDQASICIHNILSAGMWSATNMAFVYISVFPFSESTWQPFKLKTLGHFRGKVILG